MDLVAFLGDFLIKIFLGFLVFLSTGLTVGGLRGFLGA